MAMKKGAQVQMAKAGAKKYPRKDEKNEKGPASVSDVKGGGKKMGRKVGGPKKKGC